MNSVGGPVFILVQLIYSHSCIYSQLFIIHVRVVHMLLSTFAMLKWSPYILFWHEMTPRYLMLRTSESLFGILLFRQCLSV